MAAAADWGFVIFDDEDHLAGGLLAGEEDSDYWCAAVGTCSRCDLDHYYDEYYCWHFAEVDLDAAMVRHCDCHCPGHCQHRHSPIGDTFRWSIVPEAVDRNFVLEGTAAAAVAAAAGSPWQ